MSETEYNVSGMQMYLEHSKIAIKLLKEMEKLENSTDFAKINNLYVKLTRWIPKLHNTSPPPNDVPQAHLLNCLLGTTARAMKIGVEHQLRLVGVSFDDEGQDSAEEEQKLRGSIDQSQSNHE